MLQWFCPALFVTVHPFLSRVNDCVGWMGGAWAWTRVYRFTRTSNKITFYTWNSLLLCVCVCLCLCVCVSVCVCVLCTCARMWRVCVCVEELGKKKKHWALRAQKPLRLIRDGEVGGLGNFISNTYSLHCYHQNDCIKVGSCMSHFNVSLIVWAKPQDSVHKPQFLKRRAEADRTEVLLLTSQAPYR